MLAVLHCSPEIWGYILYYSDPNVLPPKEESWPLGALLRRDVLRFLRYRQHPRVTFISGFRTNGDSPYVYQGYLFWHNNAFWIDSDMCGKCKLSIDVFGVENAELDRFISDQMYNLPILEDGQMKWYSLSHFRGSSSGKTLVMGWVGGLTSFSFRARRELFRIFSKPEGVKKELDCQMALSGSPTVEKHPFWIWWSCPKPENLQIWSETTWNIEGLAVEDLRRIYEEIHPTLAGFYRIWVSTETQGEEEKSAVDPYWMSCLERMQYTVDVTCGLGEQKLWKPAAEHRARFFLQNKAVINNLNGSTSIKSVWNLAEDFSLSSAIMISHGAQNISPQIYPYSPMKCVSKNISEWQNNRFGEGREISVELSVKLQMEAHIGYDHMWKYIARGAVLRKRPRSPPEKK